MAHRYRKTVDLALVLILMIVFAFAIIAWWMDKDRRHTAHRPMGNIVVEVPAPSIIVPQSDDISADKVSNPTNPTNRPSVGQPIDESVQLRGSLTEEQHDPVIIAVPDAANAGTAAIDGGQAHSHRSHHRGPRYRPRSTNIGDPSTSFPDWMTPGTFD